MKSRMSSSRKTRTSKEKSLKIFLLLREKGVEKKGILFFCARRTLARFCTKKREKKKIAHEKINYDSNFLPLEIRILSIINK